jgi:hypothetical protein
MAQESEFIYEEYGYGDNQFIESFMVKLRSVKTEVDQVAWELKSITNFIDGLTKEQKQELVSLGEASPLFSEFAESFGSSISKLEKVLN